MAPVDVLGFVLVFCLSIHGLQGADLWTIEGDSTILPCGITFDPTVNLFWQLQPANIIILLKHPGGQIEIREDQWAGRVEFVGSTDLRIRNVSRQDDSAVVEGGYQLQGYQCSQPGSTVGERSHLHIRYPPSRITVTGYNSSSSPLHPGDKLQLSCTASDSNPAPKSFSWFRNGLKIKEGSTLTFDPVKRENNGDNIVCKVNIHDENEPVFNWEGESERIALSVTDDEPGGETTVDGPGNGVNVGLAVGLSVAAVVVLVLIALLFVFVKKFRDRPPPVSEEDGHGNAAIFGSIQMGEFSPNHQNGVATSVPQGAADSSHVESGDAEDGPSRPATGEFGVEHEGPSAGPGNNAEPEAPGGTGTGDSAQDGPAEQPQTHPSNEAGGSLPFPVTESSGAGRPTQPESSSSTVWPDIFDIVGNNLRAKYRPDLARALKLTNTEIDEIEEDERRAREKLHQVLVVWREKNPSASPETLAAALRYCKCNAVAYKVEQYWLHNDRR